MDVYWLEQRESAVPSGSQWLSEVENAFSDRLRIPKRRADWRLGRWTAKLAVAAHLGLSHDLAALAGIEARPALSGAPEAFIGGRRAGVSLSLSHSHGVAFCAVAAAGAALGCDVEKVEPRSRAFLEDYFTPEEQDAVERSPVAERDCVLTLLWSAKESAFKALQCGLRADTRSVTADPGGLAPFRGESWYPLVANDAGGRTFHGWWRETGDLVWTLVAIPRPLQPIALAGIASMKQVAAS